MLFDPPTVRQGRPAPPALTCELPPIPAAPSLTPPLSPLPLPAWKLIERNRLLPRVADRAVIRSAAPRDHFYRLAQKHQGPREPSAIAFPPPALPGRPGPSMARQMPCPADPLKSPPLEPLAPLVPPSRVQPAARPRRDPIRLRVTCGATVHEVLLPYRRRHQDRYLLVPRWTAERGLRPAPAEALHIEEIV